MIARYGPCIGITLFRFFRWKVELWYSPANYSTPEHTHENSDGEFLILYGSGRKIYRKPFTNSFREDWCRCVTKQEYELTGRKYFKWFSVRAGTPHGFSCGATPMIWLCLEKWKPGKKVTSVATDFKLT